MTNANQTTVPTRASVPAHPKSNPTYFFDQENVRNLPQDLFDRYMIVLEILSQERLGTFFTGDSKNMCDLMTEITVLDIFAVTTALSKTPELAQEYDTSRAPRSYGDWVMRYQAVPEPHTSLGGISIEESNTEKLMAGGPAPLVSEALEAEEQKGVVAESGLSMEDSSAPAGQVARLMLPTDRQAVTGHPFTVNGGGRKHPEWLCRTPTISDALFLDVRWSVVRGCRYKSTKFKELGLTLIELQDWRQAFSTLGKVYRPRELVFTDGPKIDASFAEDCLCWKTLPSIVYTMDKAFFESYEGQKTVGAWVVEADAKMAL